MNAHTEALAPAATPCFHCGETVPADCTLTAEIEGRLQPMCCPGCQAVAGLIGGSGLGAFYRQRTVYNERPTEWDEAQAFAVYDDPQLGALFTRVQADGLHCATLLVAGVTCAACAWLIEKSLGQLPGVREARLCLQQTRLEVRYDPALLHPSALFARLDALGYRPRPYQHAAQREQLQRQQRGDLRRLAVAGLGMMQVGMFAIALHAGDIQGMEARYQALLRWVSLPVTAFVVSYCARPFFTSAWRHLRAGALVMDLPVALAIGLAFLASVWATLRGTGQVYFDSVVMFTFFLLLARYLEARARQRQAVSWLDAEDSLPGAVTVRRNGDWHTVPRISVAAGDTLLLRAGATVPVDARVTAGQSALREDSFSGEHLPRSVGVGDAVYAGTVNVEANLEARALGGYADSRLAALTRAVAHGGAAKPRLQRLADRIAGRFVAFILAAAGLTAAFWWQIDPARALWVTLSVLVISCPCALALATPAALASAAAALRARGVLVRGEDALEALPLSTHLLLDKTGTLTTGRLAVSRVWLLATTGRDAVLGACAALQLHSNHPVAGAFAALDPSPGFDRVAHRVGAGMEARHGNERWRMGRADFCRAIAPGLPPAPEDDLLWLALVREGEALAWIGLADPLRPEAQRVIDETRDRLRLKAQLLSGDSSPRAARLAAELGLADSAWGLSPEDKMARMRALQEGGARVCMVGDGLNDAPVLALADTSFAVAEATDLARAQADFVILRGGLGAVLETWDIAHRCRRIIRQNLLWALSYNLCAIPLAAAGLVPPWAAALGMSLSSLLVVGNSLRLNSPRGGPR